jgi:SAM-dependent methyltransferase
MNKFEHLYPKSYFNSRSLNDKARIRSFLNEKELLLKHVNFKGTVCDVGCSTGEFLKCIEWDGKRYGMEISEHAIEEAKRNDISFDKNIETEKNYFDLVIFRGTIQHIPTPFSYISKAYEALKPGGIIAFLATPNANSLVYKLTNTLPVLGPEYNFYIPSDITLINVCKNFGFEFVELNTPYLKSPYANPFKDHLKFLQMLIFKKKPSFPFWKNMMDVILKKPE